jgi:hypothetical protein
MNDVNAESGSPSGNTMRVTAIAQVSEAIAADHAGGDSR